MVCMYCGSETRVTNSRTQKRQSGTWRRRLCKHCGAVFTSLERADYASSLSFKDRTSHIIPFDRDILFISLYEACKHRPSAVQDAAALTNTVIHKLLTTHDSGGLITRDTLTVTATATLQRFDHAAWTYYTAYHPVSSTV